ncbi:MAG: hypothetical protein K2Z81_04985 [Cyanobacteria bacterium]|nr:hypothetical protein [Cyanobacteriota bacterium]
MSVGACPYCGAKLNPGLKFCVLCGRHISQDSRDRLGGLKGGLRPSDITWRLAEIITVGQFRRSRRNIGMERNVRNSVKFVFAFATNFLICFCLLYTLVQMSLEMVDPERAADTRIPMWKIASFVDDKVGSYIPPAWSQKLKEASKKPASAPAPKRPPAPKKDPTKKRKVRN